MSDQTGLTTRYGAISLFSGAMGLDLGLDATGRFNFLACVEKEKSFADTIRKNKAAGRLPAGLAVFQADIRDLDPSEVLAKAGLKPGELDLLVGGPPCQAFSTAGRRASVQDARGTLLWEFLRFVEFAKPKIFIMENVRGLLSAALRHRPLALRPENGGPPLADDEQPGSVVRMFADDLQRIEGAAYHMDCFEVNAVNYGAPQLRERAIFIGNRLGLTIDFPAPTHGGGNIRPGQAGLSDLAPWRTLRDAIGQSSDPGEVIMDFSPRKKRYLAAVPEGGNWRSLPLDIQKESMGKAWHSKGGRSGWWRRLTFDLPCPTLVTMPNHASTSLCHPTELRALSLREYALVQEFPCDWEFSGTASQQYAQVGNAVPVRLGTVAGNVVARVLDEQNDDQRSAAARPTAYRVVYLQSHVRTRQWYKSGTTHVWADGGDNADTIYESPLTVRRERAIA